MTPRKQPWFRFYVEAIWDRKLRRLPVSTRWLWVVVLACARSSPVPGFLILSERDVMGVDDFADAASMTLKDVRKGLDELQSVGLIDIDTHTGAYLVVRWNERQFESDDVTKRTAKHRSMERSINAEETPPDTETETDIPPLPPAERGDVDTKPRTPRSQGTNPRAVVKRQQADLLRARIAECPTCASESWTCPRCSAAERKIRELVSA